MLSLVLDADVVEAPGLGQVPGIFATALTRRRRSPLALWIGLRMPAAIVLGARCGRR